MNTIIVTTFSLSRGNHPNLRPLEDVGYELVYMAQASLLCSRAGIATLLKGLKANAD